ncbi:hypothetical protein [Kallotenue papyrolyticum]|uniref:hypothetical protein n=1 Tax=Kallotenue papyrolyticum TaxID=1325125 RepID=UPI0004927C2C|nr:hypothetical protein [Kallotenue papyrolyticum]
MRWDRRWVGGALALGLLYGCGAARVPQVDAPLLRAAGNADRVVAPTPTLVPTWLPVPGAPPRIDLRLGPLVTTPAPPLPQTVAAPVAATRQPAAVPARAPAAPTAAPPAVRAAATQPDARHDRDHPNHAAKPKPQRPPSKPKPSKPEPQPVSKPPKPDRQRGKP